MTIQPNAIPEEEINENNDAQIRQFRIETGIRKQISRLRMETIINTQNGMYDTALHNLQEIIRFTRMINNKGDK